MKVFKLLCCIVAFIFICSENVLGNVEEDSSPFTCDPSNVEYLVSQNSTISSLCLTPECIKAATDVLSNLDKTVDPCEDFYHFACGGWINRHSIPNGKSFVNVETDMQDDFDKNLRDLLEKRLTGSEPEFIKMIKSLYDTCMDIESIENTGAEPLKKALKSLGGWPVVEGNNWDESNFDWVDTLEAFRKLGFSHKILMTLSVGINYSKPKSHYIFYLSNADLGTPDRQPFLVRGLNDSNTAAYYKLMVKSAKLLGADESFVNEDILKALNFEIALANYFLPLIKRWSHIKEYTVSQLQKAVPQIEWLKYFNVLINKEILENETLNVFDPGFISKFADLITGTDKRVVANYMLWRIVEQSLSILSKKWRDLYQEYRSVITGISQEPPRWKQCLESFRKSLGVAINSYYVRHYFKKESKDAVMEFVKYIHNAFDIILDEIDWMSNETKAQAKAKSELIDFMMGYPEELLNDTAVQEIYGNLPIMNESYFENTMRLKKWHTDFGFLKLEKPYIRRSWKTFMNAVKVSARYSIPDNIIGFSASFLRNPIFNKDRLHFMNFGAIGSCVARGISLAFNDIGAQYDKNGLEVNWWDEMTDVRFREKAQCFIDQYNIYKAENGMKLNGDSTQAESIADSGGLKVAYLAYQTWTKEHGEEPQLPCLNFTQNQMFWISAANMWCAKYSPEELERMIALGYNNPYKFRVMGSMSNQPEFAHDFNCPPDSAMNKKDKCQVW